MFGGYHCNGKPGDSSLCKFYTAISFEFFLFAFFFITSSFQIFKINIQFINPVMLGYGIKDEISEMEFFLLGQKDNKKTPNISGLFIQWQKYLIET